MTAQKSRFNRFLMILMVTLYLVSLAAFSYTNWKTRWRGSWGCRRT